MFQRTTVRTIMRIGCVLAVAVAATWPAPAAKPSRLAGRVLSELSPAGIRVAVDAEVHGELLNARQAVLAEFPLPGRGRVTLNLTAVDVTTSATRFVVVDASGEHPVPPPSFRSFRGRVDGEADSVVTLSLFANSFAGFIRSEGEEFTISPASFGAGGTVMIRTAAADPDSPDRPFCAADSPHAPEAQMAEVVAAPPVAAGTVIDGDTLLTAQIAIDATYQWYQHFPSLEAAQGYILNRMAEVSTIYESEVNVEIEVPYLRVFTVSSDPYADTTNTSTLLSNLRSEWNSNQTGVARSAAHLFSWRPSGGSGIAYVDVLCSNNQIPGNSFDYGVSTLSALGGSWEKTLVAHELGHNFSSPHSHCYVPELDQCANESGCYQGPVVQSVGTIMSYCSAITPLFHQRVEDEKVRPAAEQAYPTCLSLPGQSVPPPPGNLSTF